MSEKQKPMVLTKGGNILSIQPSYKKDGDNWVEDTTKGENLVIGNQYGKKYKIPFADLPEIVKFIRDNINAKI